MPSRQLKTRRHGRTDGMRLPYDLADRGGSMRASEAAQTVTEVFGPPLHTGDFVPQELRDDTLLVVIGDAPGPVLELLGEQRSAPGTALRPIAVVSAEGHDANANEVSALADLVLGLRSPLADFESGRDNLTELTINVRNLAPLYDDPAMLLLQFLYTRAADLAPMLAPDSPWAYRYPLAESLLGAETAAVVDVLDDLTEHSLMTSKPLDRMFLCPDCGGYRVLVKEFCSQCHSPDVCTEDSIQHVSCGYVGPEREFIGSGYAKCPKCNTPLRHIGVEYKRPGRILLCEGCGHWAADPELRAWCIDCNRYHTPEQLNTAHIGRYALTAEGSRAARDGRWVRYQSQALQPELETSGPGPNPAPGEKQEAMRLMLSIALDNRWPVEVYKVDVFAQSGERLYDPDGQASFDSTEEALRRTLGKKDLLAQLARNSFLVVATKSSRERPLQPADLEQGMARQLHLQIRVTELIPSAALNLLSNGEKTRTTC